jgi:hypothetical protein
MWIDGKKSWSGKRQKPSTTDTMQVPATFYVRHEIINRGYGNMNVIKQCDGLGNVHVL